MPHGQMASASLSETQSLMVFVASRFDMRKSRSRLPPPWPLSVASDQLEGALSWLFPSFFPVKGTPKGQGPCWWFPHGTRHMCQNSGPCTGLDPCWLPDVAQTQFPNLWTSQKSAQAHRTFTGSCC